MYYHNSVNIQLISFDYAIAKSGLRKYFFYVAIVTKCICDLVQQSVYNT